MKATDADNVADIAEIHGQLRGDKPAAQGNDHVIPAESLGACKAQNEIAELEVTSIPPSDPRIRALLQILFPLTTD